MSNTTEKVIKKSSIIKSLKADANLLRLISIFAVSFIIMSVLRPSIFFTSKYISSMMFLFPEYGILALAMMLAMISGGIDLSVVATANFSGIIAMKFLMMIYPNNPPFALALLLLLLALAVALAVGALCGAFIATLVGRVGIPPMLATLGGADLIMGLSLVITKGSTLKGIPDIVSQVGTKMFFNFLPLTVVVFAICALLVSYILEKTPYGLRLRMMGSNPVAAKYTGIDNIKIINKTYIIGGMLSAVSGLLLISRANTAKADYGISYIMQAIIICVLGGTNPNGGFGKVSGVTVAILILQVLSSGFNMFPNISNFYRSIIWGAVLLLVMSYNHLSNRFAQKRKVQAL